MRWPSDADEDRVAASTALAVQETVLPSLDGLPDEGVAVETASGVLFYGLDGVLVAELPGASFEEGGLDDGGTDEGAETFRVRTTNGIVPIGVRQLESLSPRDPSPIAGCNLQREGASFDIVSCPETVPPFGGLDDQALDVVHDGTRRNLVSRQDDWAGCT